MIVTKRKQFQDFSQQKKVMIFDEKIEKISDFDGGDIYPTTAEGTKLWDTLWDNEYQEHVSKPGQCIEQSLQERQVDNQASQLNKQLSDGGSRNLLMLAEAVDLIFDGNHEGSRVTPGDGLLSIADAAIRGENLFGTEIDTPVFQRKGKPIRLTEVKRQARSIGNLLALQRAEKDATAHFPETRMRLTEIKRLARSKYNLELQGTVDRDSGGSSVGKRTTDLNKVQDQAPSANDLQMLQLNEVPVLYLHKASEGDQRYKSIAGISGDRNGVLVTNKKAGKKTAARGRKRTNQSMSGSPSESAGKPSKKPRRTKYNRVPNFPRNIKLKVTIGGVLISQYGREAKSG